MMIVDTNDPSYKEFEKVHDRRMGLIKDIIVRLLADCDDPRGMPDDDLRAAMRKLIETGGMQAEALSYMAMESWMGKAIFSVIMVQLLNEGVITYLPVQSIGFFYKIGPLQRLAAQG